MDPQSIGVCSWSIDRHDAKAAIRVAGADLALRVVHLGFFAMEDADRSDASDLADVARDAGVSVAGAFAGFEHEDYTSIASIASTGGLMPDDHYAARLSMIRRVAEIAGALESKFVAIHVGTVPAKSADPRRHKLAGRTIEVADLLAGLGLRLLLETGRESVTTLRAFLDIVGRENVAINFDPGNLIVYGTDEPAAVISSLRGRIENVHVKDAYRSTSPGIEYGRPATVGSGDVGVARVISKLRATGYDGPLMIETGGGEDTTDAIREAAAYLRSMLV